MTTDRSPRLDQGRLAFSQDLILSVQRRETGPGRRRNLGLLPLRPCENGRDGRDFIGTVPPKETAWLGLQASHSNRVFTVRVAARPSTEMERVTRELLTLPPTFALDLAVPEEQEEALWIIVSTMRRSIRILLTHEISPTASAEIVPELRDPKLRAYGGWRLP
ncbi:hypothetical protein [Jiella avicenniae]|uniref:Uncharacterized protein n=1 Tax=Jiella avicenniae TaxID=2907202 RepID=A0A9X1P103_9HYPH|nr:hypothetical protein [Jiella avicenniae]MCE7029392.1 hypothetical protein [Jiella avicenniae]